jgi:hypothetical protein
MLAIYNKYNGYALEKRWSYQSCPKKKGIRNPTNKFVFNGTDHSINVPLGISGILRRVRCLLLRKERRVW